MTPCVGGKRRSAFPAGSLISSLSPSPGQPFPWGQWQTSDRLFTVRRWSPNSVGDEKIGRGRKGPEKMVGNWQSSGYSLGGQKTPQTRRGCSFYRVLHTWLRVPPRTELQGHSVRRSPESLAGVFFFYSSIAPILADERRCSQRESLCYLLSRKNSVALKVRDGRVHYSSTQTPSNSNPPSSTALAWKQPHARSALLLRHPKFLAHTNHT